MNKVTILCLVGLFFEILIYVAYKRHQAKREWEKRLKELENTYVTHQLPCPYCDLAADCRVKWGEPPETYTCSHCHESFTKEERENLLAEDREWADTLYEALNLKEIALEKVKMGDGHITIRENGRVHWYKNGTGGSTVDIGYLPGLQTRQGRLRVAQHCLDYCQAREPEYEYWLMDSGFAWQRIYKEYVPPYRL